MIAAMTGARAATGTGARRRAARRRRSGHAGRPHAQSTAAPGGRGVPRHGIQVRAEPTDERMIDSTGVTGSRRYGR